MTLDFDRLAAALASDSRVVFATLFGSARDGNVRDGSDVDIGVLLSKALAPEDFFAFYQETASKLREISELDLVDLNNAGSVLAFEAISGRRLLVRDSEAVAGFVSRVAREYEDDMRLAASHSAPRPIKT